MYSQTAQSFDRLRNDLLAKFSPQDRDGLQGPSVTDVFTLGIFLTSDAAENRLPDVHWFDRSNCGPRGAVVAKHRVKHFLNLAHRNAKE